MIRRIKDIFEKQAFGVCSRFSHKVGMRVGTIRLLFIYLSFITLGSPLIIYFTLMFLMRIKDSFIKNRKSAFEI
ncbi:MAG: PspC domain-containing protein [Flavobacteriales bacterium]|jgi:phage shock protein PspC (stress-responsive transcriptional regulator)|nr:PspC domain-containing protein [Flavobacteriales bacterium]